MAQVVYTYSSRIYVISLWVDVEWRTSILIDGVLRDSLNKGNPMRRLRTVDKENDKRRDKRSTTLM